MQLTPNQCRAFVAWFESHCGMPAGCLQRPGRRRQVSRMRWLAMAALRHGGLTLEAVGQYLRVDHSSVVHGLRRLSAAETAQAGELLEFWKSTLIANL